MCARASRSRRLSAATNTLNFAAGTLPAPGSGFLSDGFFAACAVPFSLALRATGGAGSPNLSPPSLLFCYPPQKPLSPLPPADGARARPHPPHTPPPPPAAGRHDPALAAAQLS